jgi:acetylornithine/succinyldiaminopimelate/putrescine aminotransferase
MDPHPSIAETCSRIIAEKLPNFFRLYLNPFVVQTCLCLSKYVQSTWPEGASGETGWQTFLANAFDEALSGAIKLARYCANLEGRSTAGLILDPVGRLGPFASVSVSNGERIEFVPKLTVVGEGDRELEDVCRAGSRFGFVVLAGSPGPAPTLGQKALRELVREQAPMLLTCVDRYGLASCRRGESGLLAELHPDIVVFDESFVNHEVPFGAFTAKKSLYKHWNRRGKSAFHSTTFQPNTIASLHFLRCLENADSEFYSGIARELEQVRQDPALCRSLLGEQYSRFLARAIRAFGFDTPDVRAEGHYIVAEGRKVFDSVAGVACSMRGHNPEAYVQEIGGLAGVSDSRAAARVRMKELTGLDHLLPAVSGATAVENALRLGLVAQSPKRYVLALKGGFGGKTLLALTGTARGSYKEHLDPLYEHVLYVDPFGPNALADIESALTTYPVAVVQLELIQAVGGVRPVPLPVVEYLDSHKHRWRYLLFVDEVQTGMYRTGPFVLSQKLGVRPDLMSVGKGTSDMMFPFALTLYSEAVRRRVEEMRPRLPEEIRTRYDYEWGYKTVVNVLKQAEALRLPEQVAECGALFAKHLSEELASCKAVCDIRVHGLLIAIELETRGWLGSWLRKKASWIYLLTMLRHTPFPLFAGLCQYEPNVLKLTPPLSVTPAEVRQVCRTLASVLRTPSYKLLPAAVGALVGPRVRRGEGHRPEKATYEPLAR